MKAVHKAGCYFAFAVGPASGAEFALPRQGDPIAPQGHDAPSPHTQEMEQGNVVTKATVGHGHHREADGRTRQLPDAVQQGFWPKISIS